MAIKKKSEKQNKKILPALPLRDIIIFPNMVVALLVGRVRSINTVEEALVGEQEQIVVFQRDLQGRNPDLRIFTLSAWIQKLSTV